MKALNITGIQSELIFTTSRSSGAGGQHVNKVSTKVRLVFNIEQSNFLTDDQKNILTEKLKNRINSEGEFILESQATRSQFRNKEKVIERFFRLINESLTPVKNRKKTKPTKASKEKRLGLKRIRAEKKTNRKRVDF